MLIIKPEDKNHWLKLRAEDITSTDVAALFGLSPYMTKYELWHRKKSKEVVHLEENERMRWGNRLEPAIAAGIASDNDWFAEPFKDYARDAGLRAGSSFDYKIRIPKIVDVKGEPKIASYSPGLLEIKNVDSLQFRDKWVVEDGEVLEAPAHIELQCQHQLMITGFEQLYIGALIGGNTVALIKRIPDEGIIKKIKHEIKMFWVSVDNDMEPQPNFEADANFITSLYSSVEDGKVIEADQDIRVLAEKYKEVSEHIKKFDKAKQAIKAELLTKMGDAQKVLGDMFSITAGLTAEKQIETYTRKSFRNFRVNWKREK